MVDDKFARDPTRHLDPVVSFDQCQGEIYACRYPGRGPNATIGDEDVISLDPDCWILPLQQMRDPPMRCRPAPRQQPYLRQQKRTGADAGDTYCFLRKRAHRGDLAGRPHRRDVSSDDDKRVQRDFFCCTAFYQGSTTAAHHATCLRQGLQFIEWPAGDPGNRLECAEGPSEIQDLVAWVEKESDPMHDIPN